MSHKNSSIFRFSGLSKVHSLKIKRDCKVSVKDVLKYERVFLSVNDLFKDGIS